MALFDGRATAVEVMDGIRLDSKVAIVTGANGGIGFETVRALAIKGAHVILACRNLKSAEAAKASILREEPDVQLTVLRLDLSSLASVREFVEEFKSLKLPLHILINNAGLASSEFMLTVDNLEITFATNHVGHFLLTNLLLDLMISTALESNCEGRIVIVASRQHESARGINFDSLHKKSWLQSLPLVKSYHGLCSVYAQSKLANVLHAKELARLLKERGANVTVNSLHPGVIHTNIVRNFFKPAEYMYNAFPGMFKTMEQGAATTCYVAAHPDLNGVSGKYFVDCKEAPCSQYANDPELAKHLWKYSEELVRS
ncbi:short-chain dehydrogenase TIC 32, chloroplastic [Selaginella moellendorffii]|uniref:short-chain dehydrogenase TIC 32, chloroplastic n=1 Tax=Selaginella moellendorffii TaxID=88036 RepID=UPI000D1D0393|nr:short-chain dehydrogenase TIC 32, chloroplastic [Selaginella moellendorffii]|eukprot:XP_024526323.1 short-chain dehydrogenase TIC 32, chloroplastic [Selaginella moellendorffii]